MRKSKIFILLASICLFTGCADNASQSTGIVRNSEYTEKENEDSDKNSADDFGITIGNFAKDGTIQDTVLYDQNGVTIEATSLEYSNYDAELNITITNNSQSNYSFVAESLGYSVNSINGFMIEDGYMNCDVAAGQSASDTISFSYDELIMHGIDQIAEIQVGFDITDDDYNSVYTGPLQIKTNYYDLYDFSGESSKYHEILNSKALKYTTNMTVDSFKDDKIYDSNGISIVSEGFITNKDGDRTLVLEVLNTSDSIVYFQTSNITLNGVTQYEGKWSYDCITPGKTALIDIGIDKVLDKADTEAEQIIDVDKVGMDIKVTNDSYYDVAEPVSLEVDK